MVAIGTFGTAVRDLMGEMLSFGRIGFVTNFANFFLARVVKQMVDKRIFRREIFRAIIALVEKDLVLGRVGNCVGGHVAAVVRKVNRGQSVGHEGVADQALPPFL